MASFCDKKGPTMSCEVRRRPVPVDMASNATRREASRAFDAKAALVDRAPYSVFIACGDGL